MFLRMKPGEEMDRHAYKVKLWLTSEGAWHHHLVNIMKESKSARPQSHGRGWISDRTAVTRDRLNYCLLNKTCAA